ncbi:MAG TPA: hypothetical protein VFF49_06630 [Thermodesulfobacteriota bacterium]|nr:hypothetical protein [Thermodesulfobacteriota bacterium]
MDDREDWLTELMFILAKFFELIAKIVIAILAANIFWTILKYIQKILGN